MLGEEGEVRTDEHRPEVQLARPFRVHAARHFGEIEVDPGKDTEHRTKAHHVVEVRHNIVGVVIVAIDRSLRQHDACDTTKGEQEQEAKGPQHRGF